MYLTGKPLPLRAGSLSPAACDGSAAGESRGEGCSGAFCFCSLCPVAAAPAGEPACRLAPDGDTHPGPGRQAAPAAHPAGVGQRRDPGKDGMPKTHAMAARNSPSFTQLICCSPACSTPLPVAHPCLFQLHQIRALACGCLQLPSGRAGAPTLLRPGHLSHTASAGPCPSALPSPRSTHRHSPSLSTFAASPPAIPVSPAPNPVVTRQY